MLLRWHGSALWAALITQRSQVQILPPLQVKVQVRGPFSLRGGRASDVLECVRYAEPPGCRWRRPLGSRWVGPLSVCTTGAHTPRAYTFDDNGNRTRLDNTREDDCDSRLVPGRDC